VVLGRIWAAVAAAGLLWAGAGTAQAAPGDLDTTFGQGGMATIDLHHNAFANALAVAPDGGVIVAGTAISVSGATTDVVTARFTQQGAPDPSYGQGGAFQHDFGADETGSGVALQPDGKIVVAGDSTTSGGSQLLVTRFAGNGTLDTTFAGGTGEAELSGTPPVSLFGRAMALQPNGQIVVGGYWAENGDYGALAARFNATGTPDTSFSGGSAADLQSNPGVDETLAGVGVAKDGTVYGAGEWFSSVGGPGNLLTYFRQSGSEGAGDDDLGGDDKASALVVAPDGKILVAGYTNVNGNYDFVIERYATITHLDTSFGNGGKEIIDLGGNDTATSIALQPDGKIVVAGNSASASVSQIAVVRLLANGQSDQSFGRNGVSLIGLGAAKVQANAVGLEPNGDIVVGGVITPAGGSQKNLLVVRLHGDATGNTSGGGSGSGGSSGGGGSGGSGGSTTSAGPTLSGVSLSEATIRRADFLPKLNPTGRAKGTVISATVSSAAQLTLTFTQPAPGRMANGHCTAPSKHNHRGKHCTRHLNKGSVTFQAPAGANRISFGGRLSATKKLKPGTYAVTITATANGATGAASNVTLRIKR